eukprot:s3763_g11.t1
MSSPFHDRDAEDVKKKALEEKSEEREQLTMWQEDKRQQDVGCDMQQPQAWEDGSMQAGMAMDSAELPSSSTARRPKRSGEVVADSVFDNDDVVDASHLPSMESQVGVVLDDVGLSAPVTPRMTTTPLPPTPCQQPATRAHEEQVDLDHEAKRAKLEAQKKRKTEDQSSHGVQPVNHPHGQGGS